MADQSPSVNQPNPSGRKPLRRAAAADAPSSREAAANPAVAKPSTVKPAMANGNPQPAAAARPATNGNAKAAPSGQRSAPAAQFPPEDKTIGLRGELEELAEQGSFMLGLKEFLKQSPAWLASMVVHAALLVVLAVLIIKPQLDTKQELVASAIDPKEETVQEVQEVQFDKPEEFDLSTTAENVIVESAVTPIENTESLSQVIDEAMAAQKIEFQAMSDLQALQGNLLDSAGAYSGSDFSGRGDPGARKALVAQYGGTEASEQAVAMALEWLAKHQLPDGSWSFDHRLAKHPNGLDPGSLAEARTAATGMALLPFLGAGMTHKQGKYSQNVHKGLYYLCAQMEPSGALTAGGGRMYGHGICSIAICEAYAMTQDKSLRPYAERCLQFIMMAQDRAGGGWRYTPNQAGDTSVVGWQLMALKSGHMGYLRIPPQVIAGVNNFLNTVQADGGAVYGYTGPGRGPATTAVGLLCRMYLGWKQDNPGLEKGVEFLSRQGPSKTNMYFNYYATQVLHHYEGEMWTKWNSVMRDQLVNDQVKEGHEKGSWYYNGGHGATQGGRLYTTAMCAMTLEVYYRHLPIYRKQSTADDFLD